MIHAGLSYISFWLEISIEYFTSTYYNLLFIQFSFQINVKGLVPLLVKIDFLTKDCKFKTNIELNWIKMITF